VRFELNGEIRDGEFRGTITKTQNGKTVAGSISAIYADPEGAEVWVYLGTYGTDDDIDLWGQFNLTIDLSTDDLRLTGTWASHDGGYSGCFSNFTDAAVFPPLTPPDEDALPGDEDDWWRSIYLFSILEDDEYIGYATTTFDRDKRVGGQFFTTYEPDGDGHWKARWYWLYVDADLNVVDSDGS
jgi:hypothetical protein